MALRELLFEANCENKYFHHKFILIIRYWRSASYIKHKTSFAHYIFCNQSYIFVPGCADVGIFRQTNVTNGIHQLYSFRFWQKFQDLLKDFQFVLAQECCTQGYAILIGRNLTKWCEVIKKLAFVKAKAFVSWEASIIISSNQNCHFFRFTRNSESIIFVVNIAYFLFQIVHVFRFIAGSCYPSSVATESLLYSVSDEWLVQRNGRRSSLSKY